MKYIAFSPPDIKEEDIQKVVETLRSGWITTGPKTKEFEQELATYCGTSKVACLNSATAGLELTLRVLGIGDGDEVITTAYTYTASASVIIHVGATPVLVDVAADTYEMDLGKLEDAITDKTKAIIAVDIGGVLGDYDALFKIVARHKDKFKPKGNIQEAIGRVIIIADAAHSFGATYRGKQSGNVADFTSFSFHAVKNLTTAEGGAVTWKTIEGIDDQDIYKTYMLLALHGQSKDAFAKNQIGSWEYDITVPAYKYNMTDIMAALGLSQLSRYEYILKRREEIVNIYNQMLAGCQVDILGHRLADKVSSFHLYLTRINGKDEIQRNRMIEQLASMGIIVNVHYKPLPMHTAYKNLGFSIKDYPNAYNQYSNEITLPIYTTLTDEQAVYIGETFRHFVEQ